MSYSRRSRYSPSLSPYDKRRGRSVSRSLSRSRSRSISSDSENPGNSLYVTGLSYRVTERDLEDHFSKEGKVGCYIGRLPTLLVGLLAAHVVAVEATHLIGADLILQVIGGGQGQLHTHLTTIREADLTLIPDLHHLTIATIGDTTDHTHLTTGGVTGPGPDHTRLTTGRTIGPGPDPTHLTTGVDTGPGPGHTRLTTEHRTDHTHPTTEEETGLFLLTTEGETDHTLMKVVTTEGTGRCLEA